MLKRLKATNFQSHKKVDIQFHSGVNVITGASEAGKSAIIRIIRWVVQNRPSGKSIVRKGKTRTKAQLVFDNGAIKKVRDKNTVTFAVNDVVLKAIGRDIPDEVSSVSNIEDKNFQLQHNPYFLLVKSPGEVAKELNDLAGISIIDKLFTIINSDLRKTKADLLYIEDRIPELVEQIHELDYVETLETKLERFATLINKNEKKTKAIRRIEELWEDLKTIENEEKSNRTQLKHGEEVDVLTRAVAKLLQKRKAYRLIGNDIDDLDDIDYQLAKAKKKIAELAKQKRKAMEGMKECPLCGALI